MLQLRGRRGCLRLAACHRLPTVCFCDIRCTCLVGYWMIVILSYLYCVVVRYCLLMKCEPALPTCTNRLWPSAHCCSTADDALIVLPSIENMSVGNIRNHHLSMAVQWFCKCFQLSSHLSWTPFWNGRKFMLDLLVKGVGFKKPFSIEANKI